MIISSNRSSNLDSFIRISLFIPLQHLLQKDKINPLLILGHTPQPAMEPGVFKNPKRKKIPRLNDENIPRENGIRKDLQQTSKILARTASNAYPLGVYLCLIPAVVELGQPPRDISSERIVACICAVYHAIMPYVGSGKHGVGRLV